MLIPIRELPTRREITIDAAFVRDALAGMPMREALERPADDPAAGAAEAALDLYIEEANVFARGQLKGWFEVACSRCLGPARVELDEALAITFLPTHRLPAEPDPAASAADDSAPKASASPGRDSGGGGDSDGDELGLELTSDDLDLYGYDGETIDLTALFRDQLVLAVPFAPLCAEDCQGLCAQCGADKNRETCQCTPIGDPRWAALADLKV